MTVMTMNRDALTYYAMPGPFTDLSAHDVRVRDLPRTLPELCQVVQGLIVHPFHAELYGLTPKALRQDEVQIRSASAMLDRILALDPRPLSNPRPPERRFVGNCRHFTVLLLRVPARAIGASAARAAGSAPTSSPPGSWITGSARCGMRRADRGGSSTPSSTRSSASRTGSPSIRWTCRGCNSWSAATPGSAAVRGSADPERFGILDMHGLWFVLQNLVRDLAARAKRELLPWDGWG
jgi:hypothetical protein